MQSVLGIHHQHSLTVSSGHAGYGIQACVADQGIHSCDLSTSTSGAISSAALYANTHPKKPKKYRR